MAEKHSLFSSLRELPEQYYRTVQDTLASYGAFAGEADQIAESLFPDSARDASQKNAFRHALGTGILTQKLGGGPIAATVAKLAGYGWEGIGAAQKLMDGGGLSPAYREDTLYDLNANAHGARLAQQTRNQDELVAALRRMAQGSVQESPPGLFEGARPQLTHAVR